MRSPFHDIRTAARRVVCVAAVMLTVCLPFLAGSCTSIDCPVQNTVRTVYAFQKADGAVDTLKDTMTVISTRVNRTDTTLLNWCTGIKQFSLPIGYTNPEDTLYFVFLGGSFRAIDTVWIKKENIPHFESVDCNAAFFHELTAVRSTHHAIDSIVIKNPSVTYDPTTEHFHLYLKGHR
jgi:hypothetical protein